MNENQFLHWLIDSGLLPAIGFFSVYIIRELYKDKKYDRIREDQFEQFRCRFLMKEERDLDKLICKFGMEDHDKLKSANCNFHTEDHARLSDTLMLSKTNEIFMKEIAIDQDKVVSSLDRIVDKFESMVKEFRLEISTMRQSSKRGL